MKIILTNLFTTLWCQRKQNPRRAFFNPFSTLFFWGGGQNSRQR